MITFNNFQIQFQSKIFENEEKENLERNSLLQKLTISQFPILIFQKHTPSSLFTKQSIFCISKLLKLQFRSKYKCVYIKLLLSTKKFTVKRFYFWHPSCETMMPFLTPFLLSWLSAMRLQVSSVQTTLEHHMAIPASSRVPHILQSNTEANCTTGGRQLSWASKESTFLL